MPPRQRKIALPRVRCPLLVKRPSRALAWACPRFSRTACEVLLFKSLLAVVRAVCLTAAVHHRWSSVRLSGLDTLLCCGSAYACRVLSRDICLTFSATALPEVSEHRQIAMRPWDCMMIPTVRVT